VKIICCLPVMGSRTYRKARLLGLPPDGIRPSDETNELDFGCRPGACLFVDGSNHLDPVRKERDTAARTALEDRGYRVITIRFDLPRETQGGFLLFPRVTKFPNKKPDANKRSGYTMGTRCLLLRVASRARGAPPSTAGAISCLSAEPLHHHASSRY